MAEFRNIHTRIWKDAWFSELDTDAKLLFIYLFSNERASVCGMYELPIKYIVFETGIILDRVSAIMADFEKSKKAYYRNGIVWVVNLRRYNDSGDSIKVRVRADKDLEAIPDCDLKRMYFDYYGIPYPETKIPYPQKNSETEKIQKRDGEETSPPDVFKLYETEIGLITKSIADEITEAEKEFPVEWFEPAFHEAAVNNKRSWGYAHAILKRWKAEGFQSNSKKTNNGMGNRLLPDGV